MTSLTQALESKSGRPLDGLRHLDGPSFEAELSSVSLGALLRRLSGRSWGPDSRTEFLQLVQQHAPHLSLENKSELIASLARGRTAHLEESVIRTLFLSETGERLTELKLCLDRCSLGHDLLAILTVDLDAPELRYDVIRHFQQNAPEWEERPLRVVSDIDDTIYCSFKDQRYPTGTVYPGVMELYQQLTDLPPVFLTARPELALSLMERLTHKQLRNLGWQEATVLSGSLPGLFGHRRMAEQKARTLTSYAELFPEYRFVFFGDSGQGDWALARTLLKRKPSIIEQAFIHKLSEESVSSKSAHPRIHFFEDFGQAARRLGELEYLEASQIEAVFSGLTDQEIQ